jgi:hypothetical protein
MYSLFSCLSFYKIPLPPEEKGKTGIPHPSKSSIWKRSGEEEANHLLPGMV